LLDPLDLIARLCALIPPPRFHMLRYHGVLAAHANARAEVVPGRRLECVEPTQIPLSFAGAPTAPGAPTALDGIAKHPARHPWAWLLQREVEDKAKTDAKADAKAEQPEAKVPSQPETATPPGGADGGPSVAPAPEIAPSPVDESGAPAPTREGF
jgi:hypothetical protein